MLLPSYRRFLSKYDEFERQLRVRNLYAFNRRSYWLRRSETLAERVVMVQDYTIEHIMPQNDNVNATWKQALGDDWKLIHEQYLHTLVSLTLTGYNSEYSDRSFAEKEIWSVALKKALLN
ncbi:MAG: HNH endonuclease family protein [Desulfotignum sp.]|nr:HNH endonuclease family protein [Desulfotignum sp.]